MTTKCDYLLLSIVEGAVYFNLDPESYIFAAA
jgi:hypothetical protein